MDRKSEKRVSPSPADGGAGVHVQGPDLIEALSRIEGSVRRSVGSLMLSQYILIVVLAVDIYFRIRSNV